MFAGSFDFSFARGLTLDEVGRVEDAVNDVVRAALPVYCETVPLAQATQINGLRAVFGERYPDPVRVVSVGQSVCHRLAQ